MAKAKVKKRGKEGETVDTRLPWRVTLPPEIIGMILQFFTADKASLRSCSQAAREFRHAALSRLGRHLTVNAAYRLKECALLVAGGAFQHICSLDLGINNGDTVLKADWKDYIVTLAAFSRYRTLNRLWLSEVPFNLLQSNQTGVLGEAIIALGSTVTELGLYRCCFSSYEEMVSLIRSFPLCDSLFVGDCITRGKPSVANAFAGLPEHKLSIKDLQLSSSFTSRGRLIDVSRLIGDAALDVGSLIALVCDVGTSERTQNIAAAVSASPVKQFQVACTEPGGYQAFMDHLSNWALTSLTIGPQLHETNTQFWEEAFNGLPPLPSVGDVTIVYIYPTARAFSPDCWEYFDRLLTRQDQFPVLGSVWASPSIRSSQYTYGVSRSTYHHLRRLRERGLLAWPI